MAISEPMVIWVDADSCPVEARKILEQFSVRLSIPIRYVANHAIPHPLNPLSEMLITGTAEGAADEYIAGHIERGDIAITRDIPLSYRLLEKGATVLNDRGQLWTTENIRERLSLRDFNLALNESGIVPDKTSAYTKRDINNFANCLDRVITKMQSRSFS